MTKETKPSFVPAMIENFVITNTEAKIWASKSIKVEGAETHLKFHAIGNTKKIVGQLIARLYDQGFIPEDEGKIESIDVVKFCAIYWIPESQNEAFRAAFRACKGPGKYNAEGLVHLARLQAEEKARQAAERAETRRIARLEKAAAKALKKVEEAKKALAAAKKAVEDAA